MTSVPNTLVDTCLDTSKVRYFDKLKVRCISTYQNYDISESFDTISNTIVSLIGVYIASVLALSVDSLHLVVGEESVHAWCLAWGWRLLQTSHRSPLYDAQYSRSYREGRFVICTL